VFDPDQWYSYRDIAQKLNIDIKSLEYMVKHSPDELTAVKFGPRNTRFNGAELNSFINNPVNHRYNRKVKKVKEGV
jgi:hypothetical protein